MARRAAQVTVAAASAYGDDPNPPNLNIPAYSGMALSRIAGRISFNSASLSWRRFFSSAHARATSGPPILDLVCRRASRPPSGCARRQRRTRKRPIRRGTHKLDLRPPSRDLAGCPEFTPSIQRRGAQLALGDCGVHPQAANTDENPCSYVISNPHYSAIFWIPPTLQTDKD